MRKLLFMVLGVSFVLCARAQEFNDIPLSWKWISDSEVAFTYTGFYDDERVFSVVAPEKRVVHGVKVPVRLTTFPYKPEGARNFTYSPDSSRYAYTKANDLYVYDIAAAREQRLTFDGSDLILNGYASWVYFEEIFGRPSAYRAFWWAPDSRHIAFYRFDNSEVPMFPIYSPKGQDGKLKQTRYPKAGENNPKVRIGMIDLGALKGAASEKKIARKTVWADFNENEDQYFGTPFWGPDSKSLYVSHEPRIQNTLDLYCVSAANGSKKAVYHETYKTWLNWLDDIVFTDRGLYMVRAFETGWEQIYFLSYDGMQFERLTDGTNWKTRILRVDEKTGTVFFQSNRDASTRSCLYKVGKDRKVVALTDPRLHAASVSFSPDAKFFVVALSNFSTPTQIWLYETSWAPVAWKNIRLINNKPDGMRVDMRAARTAFMVADSQGKDFDPSVYALPQPLSLTTADSLVIPAAVTYPRDFDPAKKYPVHFEIYGGPNTEYVRDMWRKPTPKSQWWSEHGIISVVADCRASGHNGRAGTDLVYRNLTDVPVADFVAWAEFFRSLPYVDGERIGVEGFSFGGTMTAMLLLRHSDVFCCGIAGGGVYDWSLYDSHYTERFMETPQSNPDGYEASKVLNYVKDYPVTYGVDSGIMLKLTHGTGDDNVHFQNTLQLVDALQRAGKAFEFMVYPDGMHGYRGAQGHHSDDADHDFWLRYLVR